MTQDVNRAPRLCKQSTEFVPQHYPTAPLPARHAVPKDARLVSRPVLGGLHHEYTFERKAA